MALRQQSLADRNERVRIEARRLLKALRADEDFTIQGIPLKRGISNELFGDLIVGCLLHYKATLADLKRRERDFLSSSYLQSKRTQTTLKRARDIAWPPLAQEADRLLNLDRSLKRHGERIMTPLRDRLRLQDPVLCLDALFRCLVRLDRTQSIEYYRRTYFPKILRAAAVETSTGKSWTPTNIERHLRPSRGAGVARVRQIAGLLLSTHPKLRCYRPQPIFKGVRPMLGEYQLAIQGRMLYSVESIPAPPLWIREAKDRPVASRQKPRLASTP